MFPIINLTYIYKIGASKKYFFVSYWVDFAFVWEQARFPKEASFTVRALVLCIVGELVGVTDR